MENSNSDVKRKDNNNIWFKFFWYVCLFPISMTVYIVKNEKMNNTTKSIVIVLMWLSFMGLFFSNSSSSNKNNTQVQTSSEKIELSKSDDENKTKFADNDSSKSKDKMSLSLGDTYDDNGVKVTLESLEKENDLNKLKIKIENNSSKDYHLSILILGLWTIEDTRLEYSGNSEELSVGKDIKPSENFEGYIFCKSGEVSYITYSADGTLKSHKSNPTAKWIIAKDTKAQEEKDEESKNASNKAQEEFKNLMPYPSEVKFPLLDFKVERVSGGFYQYGYLKYKNAYGNQIKSAYRMWYNTDGTLTKAELDNKTLK